MPFDTLSPQGWKGDLDGVPVEEQLACILARAEPVERRSPELFASEVIPHRR